MLRRATLDDIPALLNVGTLIHAESPRYSRLKLSTDKSRVVLEALIMSENGLVIVNDEMTAIAIAVVDGEWFSDDPVAQELLLYVAPEQRGRMLAIELIKQMNEWAKSRGVVYFQAGAGTGLAPERTIGLYESLGFERCAIGVEITYDRGT